MARIANQVNRNPQKLKKNAVYFVYERLPNGPNSTIVGLAYF